MPAPATVDDLLELVVKSGVTDDSRLKAYTQKLAEEGSVPSNPSTMAGQLVRDGHLTYFQAEQLLQGKWKRFTIGKYKVLERLGAGGMGQVFLCEHKYMRRRVAVKVLPTAKAEDPASLERFYREARAVAAVDHPNLVRAYDIDQDDNLHFLVMEYVDGTNLQDLVKKAGPLDITRACHYIYGSAIGLQHAHEVGLVHRDIKPGNILVDRSGVVKILDMGLARFFHDEDDALTKKYDENVLGTADYLAPEQALESHSVDIRADIYSLGATFYFLLTGSAPFPEGSVAQKLIWHQTRTPKPVREMRPEVPEDVVAVVERMMAKDMTQRYQLPTDVMSALAQRVLTPIPPPSERELPQLSPAAAGAGGQTLRATAAASVTQVLGRPASPPPPLTSVGGMPQPVAGSWSGGSSATHGGTGVAPSSVAEPSVPSAFPGGVWEGISSDTQDHEGSDTDRPVIADSSLSSRTLSVEKGGSAVRRTRALPVGVLVAGSLVLAVGVLVTAYLVLSKSSSGPDSSGQPGQTPPPSTGRNPRTLYVTKTSGENSYPTLQQALVYARSGDRIEIKDEKITERPTVLPVRIGGSNLKDVVITSNLPGNAPATIELVGESSSSNLAMIELINSEGVTLRNLILNGRGVYGTGIQITGQNPGARLDDLQFRGFTTGVRFDDAVGTSEKPIVLEKSYFQLLANNMNKVENAIAMFSHPDKVNRYIIIQQCRFEGISLGRKDPITMKDLFTIPRASALTVNGSTENVSFIQNRVANVQQAFLLGELADNGIMQLLIENNTFHTAKVVLDLATRAANMKGTYKLTVRRNLFIKTDVIARNADASPIPSGFEAKQNVRDDIQISRDGNLRVNPMSLELIQVNKPNPNKDIPSRDLDFLRYSKGSILGKGLEIDGEKKVIVGFSIP